MSLKNVKNKIRGVEKTRKVTKAMEAVSAVKMRKSQERALLGRPFATSAISILARVGGSFDASRHPLVRVRPVRRICILIVTSDRGLAGSLNSAVIRAVHEAMTRYDLPPSAYSFVCLGRKGYDHFSQRGFHVRYERQNIGDDVRAEDLAEMSALVAQLYAEEQCDLTLMAFTSFVSTFEHAASVRTLLPLTPVELARVVRDITPARGRYAETASELTGTVRYEVEPDMETVLNELVPYLLRIAVYHGLLEAKASEHSARMVAMKNASDKARDMSKELTRVFNRERQTLITREVSEIVGGIEAMK